MLTNATNQVTPISRNGKASTEIPLPESLQAESTAIHRAFPYLEAIAVTAKKNPYAMLTIIVAIASVVIIAVTTLSIAIIGSVFIMYGKMSAMEVQQKSILDELVANKQEVKVLRTYEASVLSRQNYIAGLMDNNAKKQLNQYDIANPIPRVPNKEN